MKQTTNDLICPDGKYEYRHLPTPSALVRALDAHVIGQTAAKRTLAVAVHGHYRALKLQAENRLSNINKTNILLIGPTGCGKTLLCETLSQLLNVPFVTADAAMLAQSRFVGSEIENLVSRLIAKADGDLTLAAHGIVFIDEIDKLGRSGSDGQRVQHALLKFMEGSTVRTAPDAKGNEQCLDSHGLLFICGGAFVGLEAIMRENQSLGFIATSAEDDERILRRLNQRVKPTDLQNFGLIPEFTGRLPVVTRLEALNRDLLVRVMSEPEGALTRQYQAILAADGVSLTFAAEALQQIADLAVEYQAGARSLRGIFEEMLLDVRYQIPDHPEIVKVHIASLFSPPQYYKTAKPA